MPVTTEPMRGAACSICITNPPTDRLVRTDRQFVDQPAPSFSLSSRVSKFHRGRGHGLRSKRHQGIAKFRFSANLLGVALDRITNVLRCAGTDTEAVEGET